MLLGLAGVSGVGKSYYKDIIVKELNFEKIKIITSRPIRENEKNNEDKKFVTHEELQILRDNNKIAYEFDMLQNTYAYTKQELFSNKNTVFELHYDTIFDFKKICPYLCVIYLLPNNIEIAKNNIHERHLDLDVENKRYLEIEEHYKRIMNDQKLRNMFDYMVYNNYDKESENRIINLVRNLILKEKYRNRGI